MSRKFLLIIFNLILISGVMAQGTDETLTLADKHFDMHQYENAVKLYRRVAFFGDDSLKAYLYPVIARCYLYSGKYQESIFFYQLASNTASSDSLINEYTFSRTLCHILRNELNPALQEIYSVNTGESLYFTRKYHFFLGVISLKKNEISRSQLNFLSASESKDDYDAIIDAYNEANLHNPDPGTARILSIFIPGLGQLYSGDQFNAVNSFLLTGGLAFLMVRMSLQQSILDAAVSIGPWFQRYYTGGFTRAGEIAVSRQEEKRELLLQKLFSIFEVNH